MDIASTYIIRAVLVGAAATLLMDLWALLLRRVLNIALPNYCLVGRWLGHMPAGTFTHVNIAKASIKPAECAIGWIFHYLVGVGYALILVIPAAGQWFDFPTLLPALLVGLGTVLIPYLIMQPAFGLGIAAAKMPNPTQARLKSLMTHASYGVGLYISAYGLSHVAW